MNRFGYWLGVTIQSTVLGGLLFVALLKLIGVAGGARVFIYQGF